MTSPNFLPATFRVQQWGDRFNMVIEEKGRENSYPAASRTEAEVMISLEKNRRAGREPS